MKNSQDHFSLERKIVRGIKFRKEDIVISRAFIKAFPEIALEVDATYTSAVEYITHCYSYRFLENFCEYFGFVTARRERKKGSFSDRLFVKTTPLFEKYFIWNVK